MGNIRLPLRKLWRCMCTMYPWVLPQTDWRGLQALGHGGSHNDLAGQICRRSTKWLGQQGDHWQAERKNNGGLADHRHFGRNVCNGRVCPESSRLLRRQGWPNGAKVGRSYSWNQMVYWNRQIQHTSHCEHIVQEERFTNRPWSDWSWHRGAWTSSVDKKNLLECNHESLWPIGVHSAAHYQTEVVATGTGQGKYTWRLGWATISNTEGTMEGNPQPNDRAEGNHPGQILQTGGRQSAGGSNTDNIHGRLQRSKSLCCLHEVHVALWRSPCVAPSSQSKTKQCRRTKHAKVWDGWSYTGSQRG